MYDWNPEDDWFHESNVQKTIKHYLKDTWGNPEQESDSLKRERGPDLLFEKGGKSLRVEVKDYPSDKYVSGEKKGEKKRTHPNTQAKIWFAEVLLLLLISKGINSSLEIAMGLPDFEVYQKLWEKTKWATKLLEIRCFWVESRSNVRESSN